ncbi:hypothetical protein VIGAN_02169000 [Vigna angularis var. angularis]|uniref:Uncharacterized protein n=1 Tax=Vigna angularis var. angularis TaxID=157739 RepID=A0A0S3REK7_PHAAN|nr:hypothetical protein VIGAN_02169000 [Vigna angularis var. angularis]
MHAFLQLSVTATPSLVTGYAALFTIFSNTPWTFFIFNNHVLHSTNTQIVLLRPLTQPANQNKLKPYDKPPRYVTHLALAVLLLWKTFFSSLSLHRTTISLHTAYNTANRFIILTTQ